MEKKFSRARLGANWIFALLLAFAGVRFFLLPGTILVAELQDPELKSGEIPQAAWSLSLALAPRYAEWARDRADRNNEPDSVSGTEWPLFGSVFYLEGMEALQDAWTLDPKHSTEAPAVYARDAIEAAAALITQPGQAMWVRRYWGPDYLHHADLFYRYLLISGMTSYTRLTGEGKYLPQLRDQVESLSAELEASPHGYLDDYPGQCFPPDIISAVAAIRRADSVLGTDHRQFFQHEVRAFTPPLLDPQGLPPFAANADTGMRTEPSRGSGDSFNLTATSLLWPDVNARWYKIYLDQFWQRRYGIVGFREFARNTPDDEQFADVDSGPVVLGFGVAASAFGVGAARAQGDLEHAVPLMVEMLVTSWPTPNGSLLIPRLLSNVMDAPYTGEVGILFCLTRPVPKGSTPATSVMTPFAWMIMSAYFGVGLVLLLPLPRMLFALRERKRTVTNL